MRRQCVPGPLFSLSIFRGPGDEARLAATPNTTDLRNPIIELGLQLPTLAKEVGGAGKGQRSHQTWEGQCFRAHPHRDRPHPHSICYGLEKTLMRFMTTEPLHTATHTYTEATDDVRTSNFVSPFK